MVWRRALEALSAASLRRGALALSLALGAALAAAEVFGWGGLCVSEASLLAFLGLLAAAEALLAYLHLSTRSDRPRQSPWKVLAIEGVLCAGLLLSNPVAPQSALFLLLFAALPCSLYLGFPENLACAVGATLAAGTLRIFIFPPEALGQGAAGFADALLLFLLPILAAAPLSLAAPLLDEAARLRESLLGVTRLNLSYQDYAANIEERSALDERLRLTRDIHDVVGMALTNVIMMARAAKLMLDAEPGKLPAMLESAESTADRALSEVRAFLRELRAREVRRAAGPVAIARVVRMFRLATSIEIDLDYGNFEWELGDEESFIVNHFVQEGILNAFRHGRARSIRVSFFRSGEGLRVTVRDDGRGAKDVVEGIGIAGIRERVSSIGGSIEYDSAGGGFRISILLPGRPA